jgi:hypothetical protein
MKKDEFSCGIDWIDIPFKESRETSQTYKNIHSKAIL